MALPKKDSRRINVDGHQYSWITSGNDGCIDLIICSSECSGQRLLAQFDYHSFHMVAEDSKSLKQKLSITPFIVRQVIIYGIESGWTPEKRNSELRLGFLDNKIDMKLNADK